MASAALAAAYGGQRERAHDLLAEARRHVEHRPCGSNHAFVTYVEGELVAGEDPAAAIASYVAAIEEARSVGANFVVGVAAVALASAQARVGDAVAAAAAYRHLLDYWYATGRGPQLWTTARNAATLLLAEGHTREAALLLLRAEATPEAATVNPEISRHSGRAFVPVSEVVGQAELEALRSEAARMDAAEIVDAARAVLADIERARG